MSNKKILSLIATALILSILIVGGSVALFKADTGNLKNVLEFGKVNIAVVLSNNGGMDNETTYEDFTSATLEASQIANGVRIKNIDSEDYSTVDTYVRVRIVTVYRDSAGNGTGIQVNPTFNYDSEKWVFVNGYYYYNEALSPDEISEVLINGVTFDDSGLDSTGYLDIQVLADGIIANKTAVNEAWGSQAEAVLN